jgi:hypothetical protein
VDADADGDAAARVPVEAAAMYLSDAVAARDAVDTALAAAARGRPAAAPGLERAEFLAATHALYTAVRAAQEAAFASADVFEMKSPVPSGGAAAARERARREQDGWRISAVAAARATPPPPRVSIAARAGGTPAAKSPWRTFDAGFAALEVADTAAPAEGEEPAAPQQDWATFSPRRAAGASAAPPPTAALLSAAAARLAAAAEAAPPRAAGLPLRLDAARLRAAAAATTGAGADADADAEPGWDSSDDPGASRSRPSAAGAAGAGATGYYSAFSGASPSKLDRAALPGASPSSKLDRAAWQREAEPLGHRRLALVLRAARPPRRGLGRAFVTLSLLDSLGRLVELPRDSHPGCAADGKGAGGAGAASAAGALDFAAQELVLTTPLAALPPGAALLLELRHWKGGQRRFSTAAWTTVAVEMLVDSGLIPRVRCGPLHLPLYRKPVDATGTRPRRVAPGGAALEVLVRASR